MKYLLTFIIIFIGTVFFVGNKYSDSCGTFSKEANTYRMSGELDQAENSLKYYKWCSTLTLQKLGTPYYYHLGWLRSDQKRYTESVEALKKAISIQPNYTWAYWRLGVTYKNMNEYDLSDKYLAKAAETGLSTLGDEFINILNNYPNIATDLKKYTSNNQFKGNK